MAVQARDSFTDTNGVDVVAAHTPDLGFTAWAGHGSSPDIQSNMAVCTNFFGTSDIVPDGGFVPSSANYEVACDFVMGASASDNWVEIFGRTVTDFDIYAADAYSLRYEGATDEYRLFQRAGFGETEIGSWPFTMAVGAHSMVLRMSGDQISAVVDGVVRIGPVTDTTRSAVGWAGIVKWNDASNTLTDLIVDEIRVQDVGDATGGGGGTSLPVSLLVTQAVKRASYF